MRSTYLESLRQQVQTDAYDVEPGAVAEALLRRILKPASRTPTSAHDVLGLGNAGRFLLPG